MVSDFASRANRGRPPKLFTSDEYAPYADALLKVYGEWVIPPPTGKRGRPKKPYQVPPEDLLYATVHKHRRRGRVMRISVKLVYGTQEALERTLLESPVSRSVNTSFVERASATDRHLNPRKARKSCEFSKNIEYHVAQSWLSTTYYNFCWDHKALRVKIGEHRYYHRSPAMAAGITDHVWSIEEMATYQII